MSFPSIGLRNFLDLPKKKMKYDVQVIWQVDQWDKDTAMDCKTLEGKRIAAGDSDKVILIRGTELPVILVNTDNIRLYVVAHGCSYEDKHAPIKIQTNTTPGGMKDTDVEDARAFYGRLRDLILKFPRKKVRRISLVMCNSAGVEPTIPVDKSFAAELAELCEVDQLTDDVVGRRGRVVLDKSHLPKEGKDGVDQEVEDFEGKGTKNPLLTIYREAGGTEYFSPPPNVQTTQHSLLGAKKKVRVETQETPVWRAATYVFKGKRNAIKENYLKE